MTSPATADELTPHTVDESAPLLSTASDEAVLVSLLSDPQDLETRLLNSRDITKGIPPARTVARELAFIVLSAIPISLTSLLQTAVTTFSTVFLGRLGTGELAAATLANIFMMLTGYSVILGGLSALDTMAAQAYTSRGLRTPHALGILLQRSLAILFTTVIPLIALTWAFSRPILEHGLKQNPEIARDASSVVHIQFLSIPAISIFECIKRYLQAQGIMRASAYVLLLTVPLGVALTNTLILHTPLGLLGAPIANATNYWLMVGGLLTYTLHNTSAMKHWGGWRTSEAFAEWKPLLRLAIPGFLMMGSELWALEAVVLSASYFGSSALAAQAIAFQSAMIGALVFAGVAVSVSNRIGNLLGAGKSRHARLAAWVAIGTAVMISSLNAFVLIAVRKGWARFFTRDPQVIDLVVRLIPIIALFQLIQGIGAVCGGVLRGMGRQRTGAIIRTVSMYAIGLPLALWAGFWGGYGILGLWGALLTGTLCSAMTELVVIFRTDWADEVVRCHERVGARQEEAVTTVAQEAED